MHAKSSNWFVLRQYGARKYANSDLVGIGYICMYEFLCLQHNN